MKWLWISGWAIPPAWLAEKARAAWPNDDHLAVAPSAAASAVAAGQADRLAGYSLGALWLLQHADQIPRALPVTLLAPIFSFPAEGGGGGRIARTQLRLQRRRLRQDARAAVTDFLSRAGLDAAVQPLALDALTPERISELDAELGWLETWRAPSPPPDTWVGYVGDQDPLLDAAELRQCWPALHVIAGAGHSPEPLLRAAANQEAASRSPSEGTIVASFDRAADAYDRHAAPQAALAAALARQIAPAERHGRAIEFGAGTGLFTRQMLPWEGTYLATDAAPQMVARGRANCPGAQWQVASADALGLGKADWIFACSLLQWMTDPAAVLRGWQTLLPTGGHLAVSVFLKGTLGELQSVLPEATALHWRSVNAWRELLTGAGFTVEREATWEHAASYPSARALLRAVHAMGLAPRRVVGTRRLRAALRDYDRRFASQGGVRAAWRGWLARAVAG